MENNTVEITRNLDAPCEQIWRAWSTPELIERWWGPEGFTCPGAKVDFRVGGKYTCGMRGPDGKEYWSTGTYREIVDGKKVVATDQFSDANGNAISAAQAGMSGNWPDELVITTLFEEVSPGKTRIHLRHEGIPAEMHDECVKGWNGTLDKLVALVEGQAKAA